MGEFAADSLKASKGEEKEKEEDRRRRKEEGKQIEKELEKEIVTGRFAAAKRLKCCCIRRRNICHPFTHYSQMSKKEC